MSKKQLGITLEKMEMLKKKYPDIQFNLGIPGKQTIILALDRTIKETKESITFINTHLKKDEQQKEN